MAGGWCSGTMRGYRGVRRVSERCIVSYRIVAELSRGSVGCGGEGNEIAPSSTSRERREERRGVDNFETRRRAQAK